MNFAGKLAAAAGASILTAVTASAGAAFADTVRDRQWYLKSLNVTQTRAISTGSGIVVAVLDSGTYPHRDLKRNLLRGSDRTSPGHDRDGRHDTDGHGTRMAALIGAHGRTPNSGIQGIAPAAKILPIVISKTGQGIDSAVMADGVTWATAQKVKIINISASAGPGFALKDAISAALSSDIVVVAATGNTSSDAIINYPAAFEGVLAVGATGRDGQYSSASVKDKKVQICAPGVDIISAQPTSRYGTATGTSDSTALVSGAAALVRAKFPRLSAKEVAHRLTATADDIGPPGRDDECGFGRLNIVKALTAEVPPLDEGGTPAADPKASPSAEATAVRPGASPPGANARGEEAPAGNGHGWILGGVVSGLAVVGILVGLGIRRRRRF